MGLTLSGSVQNWWWHFSSMPHTQLWAQIRWAHSYKTVIVIGLSLIFASTVPLMRCLGSILVLRWCLFFFLKKNSLLPWFPNKSNLRDKGLILAHSSSRWGEQWSRILKLSSYIWSYKRAMNAHSVPFSILCSLNAFLGGIVSPTTEMGLPKPINIINLIILPQVCPEPSPRWF